jgi:hypothetical protein
LNGLTIIINCKMKTVSKFPFLLFLIGCCCLAQPSFSQNLQFKKTSNGILLEENSQPRFFYQTATKSLNGEYPRSNYVHPLYGLDGEVLTEDFPEDHLHHHGIFWAWHQLYAEGKRVGDPWISEGVDWKVKKTRTKAKKNKAEINARIDWIQTANNQPIVQEDLVIKFERLEEDVFALTFDVDLTALVDGVEIGGSEDAKGYGGFSPRFFLPEDIVFESTEGNVEPHNLPVQAGPWMNMKGTFDPGTELSSGIVIMGEPDRLPSYKGWILRSANSMQNMAFPGKEPISIEKGKSLSFRNQILVHKDLGQEEIQSYYEKFRAE